MLIARDERRSDKQNNHDKMSICASYKLTSLANVLEQLDDKRDKRDSLRPQNQWTEPSHLFHCSITEKKLAPNPNKSTTLAYAEYTWTSVRLTLSSLCFK